MKVLCVIDSLGSGGAQRQIANLACALKDKGHDVEMLVYFPEESFYRSVVNEAGITVHEIEKGAGFSWKVVLHIRRLLRVDRYDAVISFLGAPDFYCELASVLALSRSKLIVSERSSAMGDIGTLRPLILRVMHVVADSVVANSFTHAQWLRKYPWLRQKTHVIYNGYLLPPPVSQPYRGNNVNRFRYLVIGRLHQGKNGVRLIKGLELYSKMHGRTPEIGWAGRQETDPESLKNRSEMDDLLAQHTDIAMNWQWLGERRDIPALLRDCDALLHVSLYEGLPNAVCEAFAEGRPVIASNVCDHPRLVEEGIRGVLCDPLSPESICDAIQRFEALSVSERDMMGVNARRYAEDYLTIDKMVAAYEGLI